jgi:hypothetical protein
MYVFDDSLVDAGNNDFLLDGIDLPRWLHHRTGRFTNGFNLADAIGKVFRDLHWQQLKLITDVQHI